MRCDRLPGVWIPRRIRIMSRPICDVALIERKELTFGSTWHAVDLLPLFT
ncbi:hypothetical protein QO011_001148 [Labrys wisconsinensis]|uniref:Uncharacterized protein n=1 Tax=Labrys wisconsinensis TaxID=425677 RepID=A0ABU0J1N3_9HYPH|nr:hypothetical protein [Labrys wisconsinensis]